MSQQITKQLPLIQGRAMFEPSTYNEKDNTIEVVFATETPVTRRLWGDNYQEILICSPEAPRLTRLNAGGPVLDSHSTYSVRYQFGVVENAWVDAKLRECRALIRLSTLETDKDIVDKIRTGIVKNISVGYIIHMYEVDERADNQTPLLYATDWEPTEISFCPVPADANSGVRASSAEYPVSLTYKNISTVYMTNAETQAIQQRTFDIIIACRNAGQSDNYAQELISSPMDLDACLTEIRKKQNPPAPIQTTTPDQIVRTERARINEILSLCRAVSLPETFSQSLVDAGTSLEAARAAILDEKRKSTISTPSPVSIAIVGEDEVTKKMRGLEASVMQKARIKTDEKLNPAEYRGLTLLDIAKEVLTVNNVETRGLTQMEIATAALKMTRISGAGGLSTGDFPTLLSNVLNKSLRNGYSYAGKTFEAWTHSTTSKDFKSIVSATLSDMDKLEVVKEGAEYTYATLSDSGETYRLAKYGKIINLTWETIVNDDTGAFSRIPSLLGNAVAQMQSDVVYGILTNPHKMSDGELLFSTKHKNIGAANNISLETIADARAMMAEQKDNKGSAIYNPAKYLIVGPRNEFNALRYTSANFDPNSAGNTNPYGGLHIPIMDPRINGNEWYFVADPSVIDTVEWATLEGNDIYTETAYSFNHDALQYKVRSPFAAKAMEYRSVYKNPGIK